MDEKVIRCVIIADLTPNTLAGYLENDDSAPLIRVQTAPFNQVVPVIMDAAAPCWRESPDVAIVWTRPESVIAGYRDLASFHEVQTAQLLAQVDEFVAALAMASPRVRHLLVPTWVRAPGNRGLGMLDMKPGMGLGHALLRMNARLCDLVSGIPNAYVLDAQRWLGLAGRHAFSHKLWYMAKSPYSNEVYAEAARDIRAALRGLTGKARKLAIVDLDDTLWGGIVGDQGWENLRLGGHDPVGEAYVGFQEALESITRRGIILGIVSKNQEDTALEAIRKHPEMRLRVEHFAGWRINWEDKAKNIVELVTELRLGLESVVFIDDSAVERERVRQALPGVLVPDWPSDPMQYRTAFEGLSCFDVPSVSTEDRGRAAMYGAEQEREAVRAQMGSIENWLSSLEMTVTVETLDAANVSRATQLLNKTNQMNLAPRRMSEAEFNAWALEPTHRVWAFRVADRFGDSGLVGLASVTVDNAKATVVDFVLSCRVMGRRVEETMLAWLVARCREHNVQEIGATVLRTTRNQPCLEAFRRSGWQAMGETRFRWELDQDYPFPETVRVIVREVAGG